ncbi:Hpt domain-containing protein [bacterium]|nr:Hpt domain-containing protein [bacterium]
MTHQSIYIDIDLDDESKVEFYDYIGDEVEMLESHVLDLPGKKQTDISQFLMDLHSVKGTGGSYGYLYISEVCHKIEDQIKNYGEDKYSNEFSDFLLKQLDTIKSYIAIFKNTHERDTLDRVLVTFIENAQEKEKCSKPRILVCDTKKSLIALIRSSKLAEDYDLSYVSLGLNALSRTLNEKWDYLLLTNQLQDIEGTGILYALKSSSKNIPTIIFISSDSNKKFTKGLEPDHLVHVDRDLIENLEKIVTLKNQDDNG